MRLVSNYDFKNAIQCNSLTFRVQDKYYLKETYALKYIPFGASGRDIFMPSGEIEFENLDELLEFELKLNQFVREVLSSQEKEGENSLIDKKEFSYT